MLRRRRALLSDVPYLAALAGALFAFHYYIISGRRHFPFDYAYYHFPLLHYARHWLVQGIVPFYDPYVYSGMPFYTNTQAALFYPVHLLFYLLTAGATSELTGYQAQYLNILHFAFAGTGFYALLRHYEISRWTSLVGAWLLIFNGHVLSQSQHLGVIETFSWVPLSLLALEKVIHKPTPGWMALLSCCLVMPILIGFLPQAMATYLILFVAGLLRLSRKTEQVRPAIVALGVCILVAAALGAVVVVPLLFRLEDWVSLLPQGRMPLAQLLTWIAPNIFNEFDVSNYSGPVGLTVDYHYAGAALVPLALMGAWRHRRRAWIFILLGAISFLMTFGPGWLIGIPQALPVVGVLIRPSTYAFFFVFSLLILAVHGLDDPAIRRVALPASAFMTVLGMAVFTAVRGPVSEDLWMMGRLLVPVVVLAILVAVRPRRWQEFALGLVILIDLFEVNRGRPSWAFAGDPNAIGAEINMGQGSLRTAIAPSDIAPYRVAINQERSSRAWDGMWRVWGVESINGFEPQLSRNYWRAVTGELSTWSSDRIFNPGNLDSPLYDLLNIRYYLTDADLNHPEWVLEAKGELQLYRRKGFHRRYALVDSSSISKNETTFSATYQPVHDFAGRVDVLDYRPGHIELSLQTPPNGSFLFISERSDPQWRAEVDGLPARLWVVNDIVLGLPVDGGTHRVVLRFVPRDFYYGAAISAVGLVCVLIMATAAWRHRRSIAP